MAVLLLPAILSRLLILGARVMSHDESLHVYFSWSLAEGRGFAHNPMMHGPSLFELTGLIQMIFGANDFTSRLLPALVGIAIVVFMARSFKSWLGKVGALAAAAMLVLSPYVTYFSRYIRHDILVISLFLFAIYAVFRYLEEPKDRYLLWLAAAEALMLSTIEMSFIYLAILVSFLVVVGIVKAVRAQAWSLADLRSRPELDVIVVLSTLGAFFSSPIAFPAFNPIWVRLTGSPFVDLKVFNVQDTSWASGPYAGHIWAMFAVFSLAAIAVGLWWGRERWLKVAGVFGLLVAALYTTFLTNPSGLSSGLIGSLGYWLSQQGVARGTQPWYYYLIVFPLYEYMAILAGLAGAAVFALRWRKISEPARTFLSFLIWWGAAIFIGLTLAGEKMPWLSTHIALPFILISGWWIGRLLAQEEPDRIMTPIREPARMLGLGLVVVLAVLTARTSYLANYVNYDYTTEYIDYAHSAPAVRDLLEDIETIGNKTAAGKALKVAYDSDVAWPLNWYLRDYSSQIYFAEQPTSEILDAPVVIAGDTTWSKVESLLGSRYYRFDAIRMWWPLEDYKGLTWGKVAQNLADPAMRSALWQIIWNRNYQPYAALTGQNIDPPAHWPLSDRMRIYIQKDLPVEAGNLALAPYQIEDAENLAQAYDTVRQDLAPSEAVSAAGLASPRAVAAAPDGSLYVADTGNNRVAHLDPKSNSLTAWGSRSPEGGAPGPEGTFLDPGGIAVDIEGNVFVADTWNYRIQKFSADGEFLLSFGIPGEANGGGDSLWGPRGVAVGPDGSVYVSDTGNKRIAVFDSQGNFIREFGRGDLNEPVGIAVSPQGEVFVADTWNRRVAVYSEQGALLRSWPVLGWSSDSLDNKPQLALDSAGRVYIVDPELFRVVVFSPEGAPLLAFGKYGTDLKDFGLPAGITVDARGMIWVADAGNNRVVGFPNPFD